MNKVELLIPAGDEETFNVALRYGADAIYIGGEMFSLRASAPNFTIEKMRTCIQKAHKFQKKVYITANIYAHNDDIKDVENYFSELNKITPDGVILSDMGIFAIAKRTLKNIDIHLSTQTNTLNFEAVNFYETLGIKRVVLARELNINEIAEIRKKTNVELEVFIHGAMCISYSGRCLLSSFMTNKSSNKGECTHPCRWKYMLLQEEKRRGEYMPIIETEKGTYIFNSKDLNMIEHIDKVIETNVDSLKIEGRMKTPLYIATVARTYRKAIDDYFIDKNLYKKNIEKYNEEIKKCTYRDFTTGFYFGPANESTQIYNENTYKVGAVYFGNVTKVEDNYAFFEQKNKFAVGDILEIMKPDFTNVKVKVLKMYDIEKNEEITSCPHSKQQLKILFDKKVEVGDIIRSVNE